MTVKQNSQYIKLHPSGAGENQTGATISSDLEILQVAQHRISQTHTATCYLCSCSSVSDLSACLYFPHAVSSFFLDSHAPYLFKFSPVAAVQALSGRRALLRAMVHALLTFIHDLLLIKTTYLWNGGPSPTCSQMKDFFLSCIPVEGGTLAPLPLEEMKGWLSEVMGMSLPGQPGGGWLVPAGRAAAAAAPAVGQRVVGKSALECLHTSSCACWRHQPARP